jgi:hypothetical protein
MDDPRLSRRGYRRSFCRPARWTSIPPALQPSRKAASRHQQPAQVQRPAASPPRRRSRIHQHQGPNHQPNQPCPLRPTAALRPPPYHRGLGLDPARPRSQCGRKMTPRHLSPRPIPAATCRRGRPAAPRQRQDSTPRLARTDCHVRPRLHRAPARQIRWTREPAQPSVLPLQRPLAPRLRPAMPRTQSAAIPPAALPRRPVPQRRGRVHPAPPYRAPTSRPGRRA